MNVLKSTIPAQVNASETAEVYRAYADGVLLRDTRTWSFTGYRVLSHDKEYDGGGFFFTKSLLCYQACSLEAGNSSCVHTQRTTLEDKCCVEKHIRMGTSNADGWITNSTQDLAWLRDHAGRVEHEGLTNKDGLKLT